MAIDVFSEQVVSLAEAARKLPKLRNGKSPHVSTLYRWVLRGKRCPNGTVARLETIKIGWSTCTSLEALQRFFDRLTGEQQIVSPPTLTQRQRLRQIRQAEEELRRAGI
jgi:hypothetical protein